MSSLLRKLKLLKSNIFEIEIQKEDFITKFKTHVDEKKLGMFSDFSDIFSSSNNEFKGHVNSDSFEIKRKRRFFDMNMNIAVAKGGFEQKDEILLIKTEIAGYNDMMLPFYILLTIFYSIFFASVFAFGKAEGFVLFFILIHASFMYGIPYIMMRRSVTKMAHELEREFFYMTK